MISNLAKYGLLISVLPEKLRGLLSSHVPNEVMFSPSTDSKHSRLWFVYDLNDSDSPYRSFEIEYILSNGKFCYYGDNLIFEKPLKVSASTIRLEIESARLHEPVKNDPLFSIAATKLDQICSTTT